VCGWNSIVFTTPYLHLQYAGIRTWYFKLIVYATTSKINIGHSIKQVISYVIVFVCNRQSFPVYNDLAVLFDLILLPITGACRSNHTPIRTNSYCKLRDSTAVAVHFLGVERNLASFLKSRFNNLFS